jgi:hypothetical protein
MDDDQTALDIRLRHLENMVVAQGYFLQEFAFSVFHNAEQSLEEYDIASTRIRESFAETDTNDPFSVKSVARAHEAAPHLARILARLRDRLESAMLLQRDCSRRAA